MPTITFTEENIKSHTQTENGIDFSKHGDLFREAYDEWMGGRMTDRAAIEDEPHLLHDQLLSHRALRGAGLELEAYSRTANRSRSFHHD